MPKNAPLRDGTGKSLPVGGSLSNAQIAIFQAHIVGCGITQHVALLRSQRAQFACRAAAVQVSGFQALAGTDQAAGRDQHLVFDHRTVHHDAAHADKTAVADGTGVQQARTSGNVEALGPAESQLRSTIGNLFAVAEAYPDLKANESFQQLQSRITGLESSIADRREFYNDSVNTFNTRIEQFPQVLIARNFGFKEASRLEIAAGDKQDVDMKTLFS